MYEVNKNDNNFAAKSILRVLVDGGNDVQLFNLIKQNKTMFDNVNWNDYDDDDLKKAIELLKGIVFREVHHYK
tara:strand:+ start:662 stop:880 length:219 start_codon:yes stop_codon:yes gene_type:complete